MRYFRSPLLFCCSALFGIAQSFTFTVDGQPAQCDPLSVSWTGGQAPFRLIVAMPNLVSINVTIPDSNFQDNKGSFTLPALTVPKNTRLFFAMSDATGATSGGTSNLMTVGDSWTGQNCNTTALANDFYFSASRTITQCRDFSFTNFPGATKPLFIFAFIPGGSESFVLPFSPPTADAFNWKANISAQTQVFFSVIDSQGRPGGADGLHLVAPSNDDSCLLDTGGSSTSGSGTPAVTGGSNQSQKSGSLPIGAIVGIAVGGAVVIVILAALLWWLRRRPKSGARNPVDLAKDFPQNPELPQPMLSQQYAPVPYPSIYVPQGANSSVSSFHRERMYSPLPPRVLSQFSEESSSSSSGAASSSKPGSQTMFLVHRDIDEAEEPVELPPQYNDRRAPIPGLVQAPPLHSGQTKNG